jgi:signal transduction histidine kinase/ligand-binding sensor domain-containing protein/DNA-binding response OmpR family regulator
MSSFVCSAQDYRYRTFDVANGLSNNKINCIYKDSNGFLWVGTASGLNRFDGYDFKTFSHSKVDTTSIASDHIEAIQEDCRGNLLIECGGAYSIYVRSSNKFISNVNNFLLDYGVNIWPSKILIGNDNTAWIVDNYNGAYYITPKSRKAVKIADAGHVLTKHNISEIAQAGDRVFFINKRGGVVVVNAKTRSIVQCDNTLKNSVKATADQDFHAFVDAQKRVWIYSVDGLWLYDITMRRWRTDIAQYVGNHNIINSISQDRQGNIWIGQDQCGLTVLNAATLMPKPLNNSDKLANKTVKSLYADNDGNMWIGTYKTGLYQYNESMYKFNLYEFPDVNCVADATGGNVWIGTDAGTLVLWNRSALTSQSFNVGFPVVCLAQSADGSLWLGTYRGGLKRFVNGTFVDYGTSNGLSSSHVWSIAADKNGCLWLGTLGGGVQYFNPYTGTFKTYTTANSGLVDDYVNSLCLTAEGLLYIGTTQGVSVMNVANRRITRVKDLSINEVVQVFEDSRGLIWAATYEGLYVFDQERNKVCQVDLSPNIKSHFVLGLTEDLLGDIWASLGSNVVRVHPNVAADSLTFDLHAYTQRDGLQACDFNQRSLCRLASGELLVGGLYGVNSFMPNVIKYDRRAPKVLFSDMRLFGHTVKVGEEYDGNVVLDCALEQEHTINLSSSQNDFTIYFSTDSYVTPEKTTYYYRLRGFNDEWMQCQPNMRSVTYTNLTPGSYVLEVKAVTNDGVASKNVASLEIVIHPPFWLSNWAKALYSLLAIVLIILCMRAVKRRECRKYIEQQKAEASRQQEELTQMKFRFFTNISHELRTPLTLILSPLEAMLREVKDAKQHGRLQIMHNNAERLLYLVNQLLDFRKSEQVGLKYLPVEGDVVSFTKNICDNFVGYSENKNVQLTFFSSRPHLPMLFDGDKYSKIILNLLSNAFKFTPDGGRVDVALSTDADNLVVKVADTGIGIADSEKQHVFEGFYQTDTSKSSGSGIGLSLVKEYVKLHDGTVEVVDNVGGGSVFIVTMPIRHKSETAEPEVVAAPAVADSSNDVRQRVLVVDDNADLLSFLTSELSGIYHVDTAVDGMQAIEHIEQSRPDIIISDVMMPEMDGIELCRRLKSNPKYSAIPLIILTAKHDEQAKVEGLTIGADDYITKPFNCDLLRLRIKKLLDLSVRGVQRSLIEPEPEHIKVTSLDEKLVEDAVKYVEKNMERPDLSVEELSRQLGMSRVHLYKRMRQVTGKTPIEFIRVMRLKRAAQLLRESQLNVSEIAYRVGFNNPKYFSNYFKQEFGVLPSVYQAQQSK